MSVSSCNEEHELIGSIAPHRKASPGK